MIKEYSKTKIAAYFTGFIALVFAFQISLYSDSDISSVIKTSVLGSVEQSAEPVKVKRNTTELINGYDMFNQTQKPDLIDTKAELTGLAEFLETSDLRFAE